jgi:chorismate synthase
MKAMHDLDDLGRMSAEAVLTQYEAAAIAVEDMGISVKEMVKKLGEALLECADDMKHINETAVEIREKGKHSQALIERVNDLSKSIRAACAEFKKQVG